MNTGYTEQRIAQDSPTSGSFAYFIYSPAYAARRPSVYETTFFFAPYRTAFPTDQRPDFLAPRGTVAVKCRATILQALERVFPYHAGLSAAEPGSAIRHPKELRAPQRLPPIPFGTSRRWLLSGDPLCCVCSLPSWTVFPIPFSGSLATCRTRPCSATIPCGT